MSNEIPTAELLYLDLLKRCLTRMLFPDGTVTPGLEFVADYDPEKRLIGRDWPSEAETMIGLQRLDNLQDCVIDVLERGVPGDLVEAGVWRGGAAILMRAVLAAYRDRIRYVWLADSFEGLPHPDPQSYPADTDDRHWELTPYLGVPLEVVQNNFRRYGLLDDQVRFMPGWFRDTMPTAPMSSIAVLRIDGDMYESTMQVLTALYDRISPGGYVIVDDYGVLPNCKAAVHDFRDAHGIAETIQEIDWTGIFWQKDVTRSRSLSSQIGFEHGPALASLSDQPPTMGAIRSIRQSPSTSPVRIQLFYPDSSGYSEKRSVSLYVPTGVSTTVRLRLPAETIKGPLRLDTGDAPGLIEITALAICSDSASEPLWLLGPSTMNSVQIAGTALRLPNDRQITVFSYGDDPQLILPQVGVPPNGSLQAQLEMRTELPALRQTLNQLIESQRAEIRVFESALRAAEARRSDVLHSWSWRLTRPIRFAGSLLQRRAASASEVAESGE